ncbi:MAG TPA: hypothetical protein VL200_02070 [Lacunisphaera sp.]|jgi:hypothetical protein|nr:hypothetical protein [Lacunisphaera sp.]
MKDHRFIELVNLYIDRQITAAETAELETEIQGNPRRRAIYQQYCKMHRATTLLYDSFRAQAAGPGATETPAQGSIALFESRQRVRRFRWAYYASGAAAAACLALVLVRVNNRPDADATPSAAVPPPVRVAVASQPAVAAQPAAERETTPVQVVVGPASLRNVTDQDFAALLAALRQDQQRNGRVASDRVSSLFDDGVFAAPPVLLPPGQRVFRSQQTPAQQAEFTGYQFQR